MKHILLSITIAFFAIGCGHVSHEELVSSQQTLKSELQNEYKVQSVATLECVHMSDLAQQAAGLCATSNRFCDVVDVYVEHCLGENKATGELLPATPGVADKIKHLLENR